MVLQKVNEDIAMLSAGVLPTEILHDLFHVASKAMACYMASSPFAA